MVGFVRALVTLFSTALLRLFFRRIEVAGLSRFPADGPAIAVLNHPNGLIDPAVLLSFAPRPVSFLAKAPLFRMPVVGWLTRALGSIPVWRQQDEGSASVRTRETLAKALELISSGGVLGLFPEGTSHDDPAMKPLKTGAARIALAAAAGLSETSSPPLQIVPAGLFFTDKSVFRSGALLVFGDPLSVGPVKLGASGSPPPDEVRALTGRIRDALAGVTLEADRDEALALAAWAEGILEDGRKPERQPLAGEFETRQRLLKGYAALRETRSEEVAAVAARIARHESLAAALDLDPKTLDPSALAPREVAAATTRTLALAFVLLPAAAVGFLVHYPAYAAVGRLAERYAKGDRSVVATAKVLGSLFFFPLTWGLAALAAYSRARGAGALAAVVLLPACGWAALLLSERLDRSLAAGRALALLLFRKRLFLRLVAERRAIRDAILRLAATAEAAPPERTSAQISSRPLT